MIKTININLSGIVYHINEDAYDKLDTYLKSIRFAFRNKEGGDEIIADIESRIAEIFNEKLGTSRQVVELGDVESVISTMGMPEDYLLDDENEDDNYSYTSSSSYSRKSFFRDPDNKILGGVSSGIAAYLNVDPLWIRLIWVLLFFGYGFGFLVYIILWIIVPEARTTAEKLEMKGEAVNIENIEKKIKEEFENIRDSFSKMSDHAKNADYSKASKKAQSVLAHSVEVVLSLIGRILTVIFKIIGISLIVAGSLIIPALIFGVSFGFYSIDALSYQGGVLELFGAVFNSPLQMKLAFTFVAITILIPVVLIIMAGARIVSGKSRMNTFSIIAIVIIWFSAATGIAVIATDNSLDFNTRSSITEQDSLQADGDTLVIKSLYSNYTQNDLFEESDFWAFTRESGEGHELLFNELRIDIQESRTNSVELRVKKYARGKSRQAALQRAKDIKYQYTLDGNEIIFNDYFSTPIENKMRDQQIRAILFIPIGTVVYIDKSMNNFIYGIDNLNEYWGSQMSKHYWIMTKDGLDCIDCENKESDNEFYEIEDGTAQSVIYNIEDEKFDKKLNYMNI